MTIIKSTMPKADLDMTLTNVGFTPSFSALFTPNSAVHTGFLQVALKPEHGISSFVDIARVEARVA